MNVQLSVSTGSFYPRTTEYAIERIHGLGLKSLEIAIQSSDIGYDSSRHVRLAHFDRLVRIIKNLGLSVGSLHAPFFSGVEAFSSRARFEILIKTLEIASHLEGDELIVHPYHLFTTYEDVLSFLASEAVDPEAHLLPRFRSFLRNARDVGIKVAIENISHWNDHALFNDPRNLQRIVGGLNDESIKADIDIFHSEYGKNTAALLHALAEHVMSIHASDMSEKRTRALPGEGVANWTEISEIARTIPGLSHIVLELDNNFRTAELQKSINYLQKVLLSPLPGAHVNR